MPALPQAVPFGICTRSVGRSAGGHDVLSILDACAAAGLWTIEMAYECLEVSPPTVPRHRPSAQELTRHFLVPQGYAKTLPGFPSERDAIREATRQANARARSLGLVVAVLDAFEGYEGLVDRAAHARKVDEFAFWVELAGILGAELIQIPATFDPAEVASGERALIVADLREVCDVGLSVSPPVKVSRLRRR